MNLSHTPLACGAQEGVLSSWMPEPVATIEAKQFPIPAQECVWLNNVKGLFPETRTTREQNEEETVATGQQGSFHLSIEDDEWLTEQGILYNQIGTAAS
jgi:hypothetical protein